MILILKKNKQIIQLILGASLVYLIYTGLPPWHWHYEIIGTADGDGNQFLWNVFHYKNALLGKSDFNYTNYLFQPFGSSTLYHTNSPLLSFICILLGNSFLGINIYIFFHFVIGFVGMYFLCRHFALTSISALLGAFIFTFLPYKFAFYSGQYNLLQTGFIPFFILYFLQLYTTTPSIFIFKKGKPKLYLTLILLFVLTGLGSYILAMFLVFFVVIYFAYSYWYLLFKNKISRIIAAFTIFVLGNIIIFFLRKYHFKDLSGLYWSDDIIHYIVPSWHAGVDHYFFSFLFDFYKLFNIRYSIAFLGLSFVVFFIATLFIREKNKNWDIKFLAFFSIVFFMLTNPAIKFLNIDSHLFFPTAIYHFVPFVQNLRVPSRFVLMLSIFICLWSLVKFHHSKLSNTPKTLIIYALFFMLFVEYFPVMLHKINGRYIPTYVGTLKKMPDGNLLVFPVGIQDGMHGFGNFRNQELYYQTLHEKKLVGGYLSRINDELLNKYTQQETMMQLLTICNDWHTPADTITKGQGVEFLKTFDIDYIVVPKNILMQNLGQYIMKSFAPLANRTLSQEDGTILIFN